MSTKTIVRLGTLSLREISTPITTFNTPELKQLEQDLKDTMQEYGGVGIAAPQIGINQRIIVFGFEENERYPNAESIPLTTLINPEWEALTEEQEEDWEGCLSVPGMRGTVKRYKKIRYTGFDVTGEKIERIVEDFHARVIQHEVDHLNGILYIDKISNHKNFGFEEEIKNRMMQETDENETENETENESEQAIEN